MCTHACLRLLYSMYVSFCNHRLFAAAAVALALFPPVVCTENRIFTHVAATTAAGGGILHRQSPRNLAIIHNSKGGGVTMSAFYHTKLPLQLFPQLLLLQKTALQFHNYSTAALRYEQALWWPEHARGGTYTHINTHINNRPHVPQTIPYSTTSCYSTKSI